MNITFLGATKTVTGSNFLVEAAGKKFLVDCGMYQGKVTADLENSDPFLYNPNEIDFMILTHAHIDHSGRIPKLYNEGFKGPVYATKATVDLC
jgi:metallo-beta-lactamase family protein